LERIRSGQSAAPSVGLATIMAWLAIFSSWHLLDVLEGAAHDLSSPGQLAFWTTRIGASSSQPAASSAPAPCAAA
jgi:hypothetical protein